MTFTQIFLKNINKMGALTIKSYAFQFRPWELESYTIKNVFTLFPTTIKVQYKNKQLIRILPEFNNEFLSNTLRFFKKEVNNFIFPKQNKKKIEYLFTNSYFLYCNMITSDRVKVYKNKLFFIPFLNEIEKLIIIAKFNSNLVELLANLQQRIDMYILSKTHYNKNSISLILFGKINIFICILNLYKANFVLNLIKDFDKNFHSGK